MHAIYMYMYVTPHHVLGTDSDESILPMIPCTCMQLSSYVVGMHLTNRSMAPNLQYYNFSGRVGSSMCYTYNVHVHVHCISLSMVVQCTCTLYIGMYCSNRKIFQRLHINFLQRTLYNSLITFVHV